MSTTRASWMIWVGLCCFLGGCQNLFGPKGPPRDPMLLARKPAESKPVAGPPLLMAYSEPAQPRHPLLAEDQPAYAASQPRRIPGLLTNRAIDPEMRAAPHE